MVVILFVSWLSVKLFDWQILITFLSSDIILFWYDDIKAAIIVPSAPTPAAARVI